VPGVIRATATLLALGTLALANFGSVSFTRAAATGDAHAGTIGGRPGLHRCLAPS
jgi:hypothetical protein